MADEPTPASPSSETPPPRTTGGNWRWEPPTAEELQKLMPGYTIEKILGRGGMGAVYRGVQTNLDRPVAIKILPPGVEKEDPSFAERFKSEARLMARLSHPAVVGVYDFGTNLGGQLYFAMEYVDGSDVSQMIAAQGKLPPEHALAITAHVCDALQAAHELGIVHRDIKPANVLLNMKGQVKVADFGLAKVEDPGQHGLTKTGYAMGTPDFVAPEALMLGTAIDGRADLYAVGVMLYQMLTGNIPRGAFKPASVLVPGLDPRFDPIILKAMQHDREERHQNASELRRELDVILTVPFVRNDAPVSAAIPVAQVAQAPGQRSAAQRPVGKPPQGGVGVPFGASQPARNSPPGGAAAKKPEADKSVRAPTKSKTPLFIGVAAAAAIGIGAFVMFGSKKDVARLSKVESAPSPAPKTPTLEPERSGDRQPQAALRVNEVRQSRAIAQPQPKPAPTPVSSSPSLPDSKSSEQSFPPGKWVKVFTKLEDLPDDLRSRQTAGMKDDWIKAADSAKQLHLPPQLTGNYAVRAHFRHRANNKLASYLNLRVHGPERERYQLFLSDGGFLSLQSQRGGKFSILSSQQSQRELKPGETFQLSLGIVGSRLVTRLGAELVSSHVDVAHVSGPGFLHLQDDVRDIEVINLDGLSEAEALKLLGVDEKGNDLRGTSVAGRAAGPPSAASGPTMTNAETAPATPGAALAGASALPSASTPVTKSSEKFPPGQWVKMFTKVEDLPADVRNADVRFVDGWIQIEGDTRQVLILPVEDIDNHAIRVRVRREAIPAGRAAISLKSVDKGRFTLGTPGTSSSANKEMQIQRVDNEKAVELARIQRPNPKEPGQEDELEFAILGKRLISRVGSTFVRVLELDKQIPKRGPAYVSGTEDLRDIEVINLDGLPEAEALRLLGVDEKGNDLRAVAAKQEQQMAEQTKVVDALAAIPELKALHEQFVKLQAERVTAPFEAEVAKLNAGYVGGIDREIANEKKAGHLDGVIALEAEKKAVAGARTPSSATVPMTEDAGEGTRAPALKKLRGIYREAYAKIEAARAENLKALTDPLDARLKQIEATLTQQDRIEHAKTVREYREGLGKEGGADIPSGAAQPVRNSSNGGAAAKSDEADKSVRAPLKKFPPGDDRKAAEWALDMGGQVDVLEGKVKRRIQSKADLPKRAFDLVFISIQSDRPPKPVIEFTDLSVLAGLRQLSFLEINGYPVQDDDIDYLASLPELKELHIIKSPSFSGRKLSLLKNAEKLERLNLGNSDQLSAEGIAQISQLSGLTLIVLNDCKLADADLAPLRQLKKLTILSLYSTPVTLAGWRELKGLPLTKATFVSPPGQADEWCREIASLFPDILSFDFSRREPYPVKDVSAARHFTALSELTIASTYTEDAALAEVATFPKLSRLILRGGGSGPAAKVTDEGIAHLAKLRTLQTLRLENLSEITEQGVIGLKQLKRLELPSSTCPKFDEAAFKEARPDVTVAR